MAVTQIHPIETTLNRALNYIMNPAKTDGKLLVTGQNCAPDFADIEFNLIKKQANKEGGRLAYHLIQSFAPNESNPEEAHKIGLELAEKITGGDFQVVVCTHADKKHIHNHVIFNSVSFNNYKKFNAPADIFYRIERESDELCRKYGLSVIVEKSGEKGKSYKEFDEAQKNNSWKSKLRAMIDDCILKAQTYEEFILLMEARGYEYKHGKLSKFKAPNQKNFTRLRTLGAEYSEEKIWERINENKNIILTENDNKNSQSDIRFIDIENNSKINQSQGLTNWALLENAKMTAKMVEYLTDNGLSDYNALMEKHVEATKNEDSLREQIKAKEARIDALKKQIEIISDYRKYKPIVEKMKGDREPSTESILFNAAKQNMLIYFPPVVGADGKTTLPKLPKIADLRAELNAIYPEKNALYLDYRKAKDELKNIDAVKREVDKLLEKEPRAKIKNLDNSL